MSRCYLCKSIYKQVWSVKWLVVFYYLEKQQLVGANVVVQKFTFSPNNY